MNVFQRVRGVINTFLYSRVRDEFDVKPLNEPDIDSYINTCSRIYQGRPDWLDEVNHVGTINFAKSICSEVARLTTLGISVKLSEDARGQYLQDVFDNNVYYNLRNWIEFGCAFGTIILKPNGKGIDFVTPDRFVITDYENGKITGAAFQDKRYDAESKLWYTKLEWHRFDGDVYKVSNRCTYSKSENDEKGKTIDIEKTPWKNLAADVEFENVDKPLFAVFKTPAANNIDVRSPLGLPLFAEAINELRDLDVAYSRNVGEIYDSKRIVLLDSDRLMMTPGKKSLSASSFEQIKSGMGLPDYVKAISGTGADDIYHEINPTLNTAMRITGIDALLSQIGYKCGFANGYFVFDAKTGLATATQIEAEQQRTIQLIKDIRDRLEECMDDLFAAMSEFADIYSLSASSEYEVTYGFGDITYNVEEDRARWYSYCQQGKIEFWRYLVKFEGMTEDEAKEMTEEAKQAQMAGALFGGNE